MTQQSMDYSRPQNANMGLEEMLAGYQVPNLTGYQHPQSTPTPAMVPEVPSLAKMPYPGIDQRNALGKGGTLPPNTLGEVDVAKTDFFGSDTTMGRIGEIGGLAQGALSLASAWQGLTQGKKSFELNKENIEDQMSQRKEAFNRNTARQDANKQSMEEAAARAASTQQQ